MKSQQFFYFKFPTIDFVSLLRIRFVIFCVIFFSFYFSRQSTPEKNIQPWSSNKNGQGLIFLYVPFIL